MTNFTGDGLFIEPQDLSNVSPESSDSGRTFHHDGSNQIPLTGGISDSSRGLYTWDDDESAWFPHFTNADKLDGKEAGDFLLVDGSTSLAGSLDLATNKLLNASEIEGGTGGVHLNTNHVVLHSHKAGANIRFVDSNGLLIAEGSEGGNFDVPNGQLSEAGSRVATRNWTEANADVPNADYADDAGALDGSVASDFLHVSGDQMEGVLDLGGFDVNDGGTTVYDGTAGVFVQSALGGPASSLSTYPLGSGDLAEDYALTSRFPLPAGDLAEDYALTSRFPLPATDLAEDYALTSRFPLPESDLAFDTATQSELDTHAGTAGAHHTRYADSEAVAAVNGEVSLSVDISGDANTVDGYDIQKNGTDGSGIINFKTQ